MPEPCISAPYYPIIYVRGYAGNDDEIEDTVSDPYMGFNLGSTRLRQLWTGDTERHYFESPLVRLMKDFGYRDVYSAGLNMAPEAPIAAKSIVIYRYYDQVSTVFGAGKQVRMETFGQGLSDLILALKDRICKTTDDHEAFRVYLVGHSMGGLVIRTFLQNDAIGSAEARSRVNKVFTYATPHNGIEMEIIGNVPAFFTHNSVDNFNRKRMREYLALPAAGDDGAPVNSLDGKFDIDRFFCLVGTNAKDYLVAKGWSSRVVGPFSDGLVRIDNAILSTPTGDRDQPSRLGPRAYAHRSHSGYYGIVNSEEGYQNLTRFLFGDVRADGRLAVKDITLPQALQALKAEGKEIRASYHFEAVARVRGANWDLSRRLAAENSAVFRKYGELFPEKAKGYDQANRADPELFTVFLRSDARVDPERPSLGFSIDLGVQVPEYEVDGKLWLKDHFAGGYLYRDKINLEAFPPGPGTGWKLLYGFDSMTPNRATIPAALSAGDGFIEFGIPIVQNSDPGITATLAIRARPWNVPD